MPDLTNDIRTGFDNQTLFDIGLDTSKRMDAILNVPSKDTGVNVSNPMTSAMGPKDYNPVAAMPEQPKAAQPAQQDNSLKDIPQGMSLGQALLSNNPKLQELASDTLARSASNDPYYKYNMGSTLNTPKEIGDKFVNKKFGYDALVPDMEDYYYKGDYMQDGALYRSLVKNPLRFLGRVAGGTVAKLGEGLGYTGSLITSIGSDNYFQSVADNAFSKFFEKKEQWWKDQVIPIYKQAGFDQKGFFSKLGDWSFWNESVSDGVAFMASATLQGLATGGLADLAGLGELGAVGIDTASHLSKYGKIAGAIGKGLDVGIETFTGAENLGGIGNWALNTTSEAAFEATGVFNETLDSLKKARANGDPKFASKTDKELEAIAGSRASSDFKGNLLALSLSNAFENKFIFQPLKNKLHGIGPNETEIGGTRATVNGFTDDLDTSLLAAKKQYNYTTKVGKYLNWKDPQSRLRFYGTRATEAAFMEGLYEENVQLAIERLSNSGGYENKGVLSNAWDTVKQSAKQAKDAYQGKDKEAGESIGLGALIGIGGTSIIAKTMGGKGLKGERRTEIENAQRMIDNYNTSRKEFLSFNDIYKKDENGVHLRDDVGGLIQDEDKIKARSEGLSEYLKKQVEADKISNPVTRKFMQDDLFSDYIHAASRAGILPTVLKRMDGLQDKSPQEIIGLGFNPAEIRDATDFQKSAKELAKIHEESFSSSVRRPSNISYKDFAENEDNRRYYLYKARSTQRAAERAHELVDNSINHDNAENLPSSFSSSALDYDPLVQKYNSLTLQEKQLGGFDNLTGENTDFYKPHVEDRKKDIQAEKDQIKEALKDHLDTHKLMETEGFLFTPVKNKDFLRGNIAMDNQATHAGYANAKEQWKYLANQLSHPSDGHRNYLNYRDYLQAVQQKDQQQDEKENPAPPEEEKPKPPAPPPPPKQEPVLTPEQDVERRRKDELDKLSKWAVDRSTDTPTQPEKYTFDGIEHSTKEEAEAAIHKKFNDELEKLKGNRVVKKTITEKITGAIQSLLAEEKVSAEDMDLIHNNMALVEPILQKELDKLKVEGAQMEDFEPFLFSLIDIYTIQLDEDGEIPEDHEDYNRWGKQIVDFLQGEEVELTPEEQIEKDRQEELEIHKHSTPETIAQINAKYDAKLAALKKPGKTTVTLEDLPRTPDGKSILGLQIYDAFTAFEDGDKVEYLSEGKVKYGIFNKGKGILRPDGLRDGIIAILNAPGAYIKKVEDSEEDPLDKVKGRKQVKAALQKLDEAKTSIEQLNAIHSFERNIAIAPDAATQDEKDGVAAMKASIKREGYEIYDLQGKDFNSGMKVIVVSATPDDTLEEGKEIISKVITPQVNKDGVMVQAAHIEIKVGTKVVDVVSDDEWKDFIDKNKVSQARLEDLAKKTQASSTLSPREQAIYAGKTAEINDILKKWKEEEDKKNRKPVRPAPIFNENNIINSSIDEAKKNGAFTFVSVPLNEVKEVKDGVVVLKTVDNPHALRVHNFLRHLESTGEEEYRIQLVNQDEDTDKWHYQQFGAKGPIAVLVDEKGEKLLFDQDGSPSADGLPVSFQFSANEYSEENLSRSRKEMFSKSTGTLKHGFKTSMPLMSMNVAINKGIPIYGKINLPLNGKMSAGNSSNELGQKESTPPVLRTMEQMIKLKFLSDDPSLLIKGQENYFQSSGQVAGGELKEQLLKVGQPFVIDNKSGLAIAFNGVKLRDLSISKSNTFFPQLIEALDEKDGRVEMGSEQEALDMRDFLRTILYSEKVGVKIDPKDPKTVLYDIKVNMEGTSLADQQINFNDADFQVDTIHIPGDKDPIDYLSFVRKNFVTGATPAKVTNSVTRFEKLNKRVIFTLDKNQEDMLSEISKKTQKVDEKKDEKITPDEQSLEQFNNTPKISKELFAEIMAEKDSVNLEELNFGCS